jgi:hypothetical protein
MRIKGVFRGPSVDDIPLRPTRLAQPPGAAG